MSLFSERFDSWLTATGLTRYQVAKAMGGPGAEDQIRKWLKGEHEPSARSVRRVAQALGLTEGDFWAGPANAPAAGLDRRAGAEELTERLRLSVDRVAPRIEADDSVPATPRRRRGSRG